MSENKPGDPYVDGLRQDIEDLEASRKQYRKLAELVGKLPNPRVGHPYGQLNDLEQLKIDIIHKAARCREADK